MRRIPAVLAVFLVLAVLLSPGVAAGQAVPSSPAETATPMAGMAMFDTDCGLAQAAFCDTFAAPSPGGRAGDLDDAAWSFARLTEGTNQGQEAFDWYPPTDAMFCRTPISGVLPPQDSFFCNAAGMEHMHWMTALNDGDNYAFDSARVRQPFDFAGRTGTIAFGVDAVTRGDHSWWPQVVISDQPIPGAHDGHPATATLPRNGIALSFNLGCGASDGTQDYPGTRLGALSVFRDYVQQDIAIPLVSDAPCVKTARDTANMFQIRVSRDHLEVWGGDAGTGTLRLLNSFDNIGLSFSRGYVSFEQAQYAAEKFNVEGQHTYHWHDLGFDGPALPTPRAYEVPDAMTPMTVNGVVGVNLGWQINGGTVVTPPCCPFQAVAPFVLHGVDPSGATGAVLSFDAFGLGLGHSVSYRLGGGAWHAVPFPLPADTGSWVALVAQVPLADLRAGDNTLQFTSDADPVVANIDLEIGAMAGSPEPTATATPTPAATPTQFDATGTGNNQTFALSCTEAGMDTASIRCTGK